MGFVKVKKINLDRNNNKKNVKKKRSLERFTQSNDVVYYHEIVQTFLM